MAYHPPPRHPDMVLTRNQFNGVLHVLSNLARKCRISAVLLVNSSGQILAEQSERASSSAGLATLAASSFAASREMARLLNEVPQFRMVLYEGQKQNVFIASVSESYFLIVVFGKETALGMVRVFTRKTIEELVPVLESGEAAHTPLDVLDETFQEALNQRLDQTFGPDPA